MFCFENFYLLQMDMLFIQKLFRQILSYKIKYDEISKLSGEHFNIFRILKLDGDEVRLHSALLGELLNPNGSHGMGDLFLSRFIILLNIQSFDTSNAKVFIEKSIGFIQKEKQEGGRIDIVITDNKDRGIIIENKIFASDQEKQLVRYYNYGNSNFPKGFNLYYLSLFGQKPRKNSTCGELSIKNDFQLISYKDHIIKWLEECRKEAAIHPMLRETISQYINLIKHLTGQSISYYMENEIVDLIRSDNEYIKAAYLLKNSSHSIFDKFERELIQKLQNELRSVAESLSLIPEFDPDFGKQKYDTDLYFWVKKPDLAITFGFDEWRMQFHIGLWSEKIDSEWKKKITQTKLNSRIGESHCKNEEYPNYYYVYYFEDRNLAIWDKAEIWISILNGSFSQQLKTYLEVTLEELHNTGILNSEKTFFPQNTP